MTRDLNELAKQVHKANAKWWHDLNTGLPITRNKGELLQLVSSELAEAMEGERKGLMDDKLPHRPMPEVEMADTVIRLLDYAGAFGHVLHDCPAPFHIQHDANRGEMIFRINKLLVRVYELETASGITYRNYIAHKLSQAIAACEFYCNVFGYDLWDAYEEKMDFNGTRVDHSLEARRASGGKKW